jgi:hypothetical protein
MLGFLARPIMMLSGGKPWGVLVVGAIGFLILFLLVIFVMYPRRRD